MMFNDSKLCAVSQTQWSASLPTAMFFHHYWLCVFVELVQKKAYDLILTTCRKKCSSWMAMSWSSSWHERISVSVPGHGPHTTQQAVERHNCTLKQLGA